MCRWKRHVTFLLFLTVVTLLLTLITGCAETGAKENTDPGSGGHGALTDPTDGAETQKDGGAGAEIPEEPEVPDGPETGESAPDGEENEDMIRMAIKLEMPSVAEKGYSIQGGIKDPAGLAYLAELEKEQDAVIARIEEAVGHPLDVVWRFTMTTNTLSVNVSAGDAAVIETVEGVASVTREGQNQLHGASVPGLLLPDVNPGG